MVGDEVDPGQGVAAICGDSDRCLWPLGMPPWWPPPRVVHPAQASARWVLSRCADCRRARCLLVAAGRLERGAEVTVGTSVILGDRAAAAFEVEATFDGGAR